MIDFDLIYCTTGNGGPKLLSHKQYERITTQLFSQVTKRIKKLMFGESDFSQKYGPLLSGIRSEDFSLRQTGGVEFECCLIPCESHLSCVELFYFIVHLLVRENTQ